jgi:hypothetical protein
VPFSAGKEAGWQTLKMSDKKQKNLSPKTILNLKVVLSPKTIKKSNSPLTSRLKEQKLTFTFYNM